MRILPAVNLQRSFVNSSKNSLKKLEGNNDVKQTRPRAHKYTGVASADLAYASMFDSAIARDLKMMGLI